jgi:hypothetical protein
MAVAKRGIDYAIIVVVLLACKILTYQNSPYGVSFFIERGYRVHVFSFA